MTFNTQITLRLLLSLVVLMVWDSTAISGTFVPPDGYVFDSDHQVSADDIVWVVGNSTASMVPGGRIGSYLWLFDSSKFTMHGGNLDSYVRADDSSHFIMQGGNSLGYIDAARNSHIDIYGGNVNSLYLENSGTINVYGTNFSPPIAPGGFGNVTGVLADGTPLNAFVVFLAGTTQARLNLISVPEPSSYLLAVLAFGASMGAIITQSRCRRFRAYR